MACFLSPGWALTMQAACMFLPFGWLSWVTSGCDGVCLHGWHVAYYVVGGCFVAGTALLLVVREARCAAVRAFLCWTGSAVLMGSVAPNSGVHTLVLDQ